MSDAGQAHLGRSVFFTTQAIALCGYVFTGKDKVYLAPSRLRRQPNPCTRCLALHDAKATKFRTTTTTAPSTGGRNGK